MGRRRSGSASIRSRAIVIAAVVSPLVHLDTAAGITASWLNAVSGSWTDGSKWSTSPSYPANGNPDLGDAYDVAMTATGAPYTIQLASPTTVNSLELNSPSATFQISSTTLAVVQGADLSSGTLLLNAGTISATTLTASNASGLVAVGSSTLDHVLFGGSLAIQNGSNTVLVNGAAFDGATISLNRTSSGSGTSLTVPDQLDGTNTFIFNGTYPDAFVRPAGATLTIGPQVSFRTGTRSGAIGVVGSGTINVINYGTISAETGGESISIAGTGPINYGTLQVSAGQLRILGNWNNLGTMAVSGGSLAFGGTFSAANVGTIVQSGDGKVRISGTYNNTGQDFVISESNNYWGLSSGTINGGTLSTQGGGVWTSDGGTVNGVVLNGYMHQLGILHVLNGITLLNGSSISVDGATSAVYFDGNQTISGNGEIRFEPTGQLYANGGVATISSGITIRTGSGGGYLGATFPASFYNAGLVSAQTAGMTIQIAGYFNNASVVEARNGGAVRFSFTPTNLLNGTLTGGTWQVFDNSSIAFDQGAITVNAATILLNGAGASIPALSGLSSNRQRLGLSNGADLSLSSANLANSGSITVDRSSVLRLGASLSFSGGTLDLGGGLSFNNIINPTSTLTTTRGLLANGYAGGAWNGPGLNSSAAAAIAADWNNPHKTAIGYARPSTIGMTSFFGKTVGSFNVVALYTLSGDANLDQIVNTSDFDALAANFGSSGKIWSNGDFNYDGVVNALDFNALASNFGSTMNSPALGTLLPEPTGLVASLATIAALCRRRRARL